LKKQISHMSDTIIRKANTSDLESILALINTPEVDNGKTMELRDANTIYQSILHDPNYFQFVASSDQGIIGIVTLVIIMQMTHEGATTALITDLVVVSGEEKVAITSQLLKYATDLAQEYGCYKTIIYNDYQQDETLSACQDLGFEQSNPGFLMPE